MRALAAGHLPQHSSPTEPLVAVVKVPDERLDRLATLVNARKTTYLELRLLDFPSFSVGKKGPPGALLGALSTADLLVRASRPRRRASMRTGSCSNHSWTSSTNTAGSLRTTSWGQRGTPFGNASDRSEPPSGSSSERQARSAGSKLAAAPRTTSQCSWL